MSHQPGDKVSIRLHARTPVNGTIKEIDGEGMLVITVPSSGGTRTIRRSPVFVDAPIPEEDELG